MPNFHEKIAIRAAEPRDAKPIADIYNHFVTESAITFEEEPVTSEEIARRIEQVRSVSLPWLVADDDGQHLLPILQTRGIHAVIGGIALPNEASVALHEKFGLRKVAHFQEVGFKFNRWIDVGYWQLVL